jgi:mannosyl-3-phosphoglycerate phosphatase
MQAIPALVFSDLDGTLLDHHDYRFDAALPALRRLRRLKIPLILATSKTLAEVADISRALRIEQPVIVENGGALCFPSSQDYPFEITAHEHLGDYAVIRFSPPYAVIRAFVEQQRGRHGWQLRGFGDMTVEEVAERTGLDPEAAGKARQRLCSEPFLWLDSADHLAAFRREAQAAHLNVTRGGRFLHLMGQAGKADALQALHTLYGAGREQALPVIALGDSENDKEMLQAADIAVIVERHDGTHLDCHGIKRTLRTELPGPAGWNAAVLQLLDEMVGADPTT